MEIKRIDPNTLEIDGIEVKYTADNYPRLIKREAPSLRNGEVHEEPDDYLVDDFSNLETDMELTPKMEREVIKFLNEENL